MIRPTPDLMAFHDGTPVEFLHLIRRVEGGESWLVRPLFVADPVNTTRLFREGDRLTPLHTRFH
jgi:hypothetical protein